MFTSNTNIVFDACRNLQGLELRLGDNNFIQVSSMPNSVGSSYGYASGGGFYAPLACNEIDRFAFASTASSADVGDISVARWSVSGASSKVNGYTMAGYINPPLTYYNVIDKFPFAAINANSSDVGDLTCARSTAAAANSNEHGYASGGFVPPTPAGLTMIDKFPFATNSNSQCVGALGTASIFGYGNSSQTNGYVSSRSTPTAGITQKFPFASSVTVTTTGSMLCRLSQGSTSSMLNGYTAGGYTGNPVFYCCIERFPFSTDAGSIGVGTLSQGRGSAIGQSSTDYGHFSGGQCGYIPYAKSWRIDRFPFANESVTTCIGNLAYCRAEGAGHQV